MIDEAGVILAGNGIAEATAEIGIVMVLVVPADGRTLVAVQRTDLSPAQKAEDGVADNRSSELSEFDGAALADLLEEGADLDMSPWFSDEEWRQHGGGDRGAASSPRARPHGSRPLRPDGAVQLTFPDQQALTVSRP